MDWREFQEILRDKMNGLKLSNCVGNNFQRGRIPCWVISGYWEGGWLKGWGRSVWGLGGGGYQLQRAGEGVCTWTWWLKPWVRRDMGLQIKLI